MKCRTFAKWISDDLDGRLSGEKKKRLESHLLSCDPCRRYMGELFSLQAEAMELFGPERSPEFWENFARRLESKVSSSRGPHSRRRGLLFARWISAAAGAVLLTATGFLLLQNRVPSSHETFGLSLEDSLSSILQEIGSDQDLEASFNRHVLASIGEIIDPGTDVPAPQFGDNPFFWESLSLEELTYLETELRKGNLFTEVPYEAI